MFKLYSYSYFNPETDTEPEGTSGNPLEDAIGRVEGEDTKTAQQNLFSKTPLFEFAGASERIDDANITFEELRQQKYADFPEMEEKKIPWSVTYGKITKLVSNPKTKKVWEMKREIETSITFIDALKKTKTKITTARCLRVLRPKRKGLLRRSLPTRENSIETARAS